MSNNHALSLRKSIQSSIEKIHRSNILNQDSKSSQLKEDILIHQPGHNDCGEQHNEIRLDAIHAAQHLKEYRERKLQDFWKQSCAVDIVNIAAEDKPEARKTDKSKEVLTFKRRYIHANIPAVICGLDSTSFSFVSSHWKTIPTRKDKTHKCHINSSWFVQNVGASTSVPVRKQSSDKNDLDEDGRAEECETIHMTMQSWIDLMEYQKHDNQSKLETHINRNDVMYLKDWHLQNLVQKEWCVGYEHVGGDHDFGGLRNKLLYTVPSIFSKDLLNDFLLSHQGGDYRFCYWGPTGSCTALHSDVLNSFSWSYNVVGEKKWMLYPPNGDALGSKEPITLIQKTGETIFVPSGWRHEVINLQETLSINHNWTTAASLDKIWDVIVVEINAIEKELKAWGMGEELYLVRENMLRGCVGMDVSSFCVLLMTSLLECMEKLNLFTDEIGFDQDLSEDELWEYWFDLSRLLEVLNSLFVDSERNTSDDKHPIHLKLRLSAVLNDADMASQAVVLMHSIYDLCVGFITKRNDS